MAKRRLSDKNRRRLLIATAVVVVIALILWALPIAVRWGAAKYLTDRGVDTRIEDIDLNLFTGTLGITNAHGENDQGEGFEIDHALVNLDYWPLVHKQIYLSRFELHDSRVDVRLDKDGKLSIAGLAIGGGAEKQEPEAKGAPWGFGLERAKIGAFTLHYAQPDFDRTVTLSSSSTSDIATWEPDEPFPLDASLRVGDSRILLSGELKPFGKRISGDVGLKISNFKLKLVAPLVRQAGVERLAGVLSSDLKAKLDYAADSGLKLDVDGKAGLAGTQLTTATAHVKNADFAWQGRIQGRLLQPGPHDTIKADGELNLDQLDLELPDTLALTQGGLRWQGRADTTLTAVGPSIDADGKLQATDTRLQLADGGTTFKQASLDWHGKLDAAPGKPAVVHSDSSLTLAGVDLDLPQQRLAIAGKRIAWSGRLALDPNAEGIADDSDLPLSADGQLDGDAIAVTDSARGKRLAALDHFSLNAIAVRGLNDIRSGALKAGGLSALARAADAPRSDTHPNIVQVGKLTVENIRLAEQRRLLLGSATVDGVDGLLYRGSEDGGWEIAQWFASSDNKQSKADTAATPAGAETASGQDTGPGFTVALQQGRVRNGRLTIDDRGVTPAFATQLSKLDVAVADLDSAEPKQGSALDITSTIGRYGSLKVGGTVKPFLEPPSAKLTGKINAINLAPISGYAAQAIDRRIDQGTFSADLKFNLNRGDIDANAQLTLTKLHIGGVQGKSGEVENKLGLPLDKILSLLRDGDGNIKLNLPVGGDLQNPTFSIVDVVRKAILKGLQTAVIAVYSPLGLIKVGQGLINLATALHFDPVLFDPGGSSLTDDTRAQLDKVAKVLNEHPDTELVLCGHAVPADRKALGLPGPGQSVPEGETPPTSEQLANASDALLHLADARAGAVGGHLVSQGLAKDRLVPCNPSLGEPEDAKPRTTLSF